MKRGVARLIALALVVTGCHSDGIAGTSGAFTLGITGHSLVVGELSRRYILHVPAKRPVTQAGVIRGYGLVIVLHGSSGSAADMEATTQFDSLAEASRYVVVYAEGYSGGGGLFPSDWNAGDCCGASARENIDDLGYIAGIIQELKGNLSIDSTRVYAAGFSDGGRMAYYLGCRMGGTFAAIAVVSGSITDSACRPARPVPLLAIHGTSDTEIPYGTDSFTPPPSIVDSTSDLPPSVQFWTAANTCSSRVDTQQAPDVLKVAFKSCPGGDVQFFRINAGQHAWPGDTGGVGSIPPMSELNASAVISAFFVARRRR